MQFGLELVIAQTILLEGAIVTGRNSCFSGAGSQKLAEFLLSSRGLLRGKGLLEADVDRFKLGRKLGLVGRGGNSKVFFEGEVEGLDLGKAVGEGNRADLSRRSV